MTRVRFGVVARLVTGVGTMALLAGVVALVAWASLRSTAERLDDVALRRLPEAVQAGRLGRQAQALADSIPLLVSSDGHAARRGVARRFAASVAGLAEDLEALRAAGLPGEHLTPVVTQAKAVQDAMGDLDALVAARIDADKQVLRRVEQVHEATAVLQGLRPRLGDDPRALGWALAAGATATALASAAGEVSAGALRARRNEYRLRMQDAEAALARVPAVLAGEARALQDLLRRIGQGDDTAPGIFTARDAVLTAKAEVRGRLRQVVEASDHFLASVWDLVRHLQDEAAAAARRTHDAQRRDFAAMAALTGTAGILAAALLLYLDRRVLRRLRQIRDALAAEAEGRPAEIPLSGNDEVTAMARSLEALRGAIHAREEALQASREQARQIAETAPVALVITRIPDRRVLSINQRACEMFESSREDALAHVADPFYANPEDRMAWQKALHRDGYARDFVLRMQTANGRPFTAMLSATKTVHEGQLAWLVALVDITQRLRTEASLRSAKNEAEAAARDLARSNADLEQFAYVASHDLREPLRTVASYVNLLQRRHGAELSPQAQEFIAFARGGVERMERLIQDLLEYSRAGRAAPPEEPVPLDRVMRGTLVNLEAALRQSEGRVVVETALPSVRGDESDLLRLMQNLVGNALKYRHPERPPEVRIAAHPGPDGGWTLAVSDNGIGIAETHFERIFMIFQRLHGRGTFDGTGIGLAICRKIAERLGGAIRVDSEEGIGTTFSVTLPAAAVEAPALHGVRET